MGPKGADRPLYAKCFSRTKSGGPQGRPKPKRHASGMLTDVPAAAAEVAAAETTHVAAAKAAHVAAPETTHVAEVSADEARPAALEAVVEAETAIVEARPKAKAAKIRPVVAVIAVVAPAVRTVAVIVAGIRIACRRAADHSSCNGCAGVVAIAIGVAMRMGGMMGVDSPMDVCNLPMDPVGGVMNDRRRACGGKRG